MPEQFRFAYADWMTKCADRDNVEVKLAVDNDIHRQNLANFEPMQVDNPRRGIVKPLFELCRNLKIKENDIVVVPSDDFYPPERWDEYLQERCRGVFQVNDGHMSNIISMPVMTGGAFLRMNRTIYHPAYNHMFSDQELYDTAHELGICSSANPSEPEFEHRHWSFDKRKKDEHDEPLSETYAEMKELYKQRRYLTLIERMDVTGF